MEERIAMKWNNLKIGYKLGVGFSIVLFLLIVVLFLSIRGTNDIVKNAEEVIYGNKLDSFLGQKEIDHLKWVGKLDKYIEEAQKKPLDLEKDDHKCSFGKFLYGKDRKEVERKVPDLAPFFQQIETPHRKLHESAIKIEEIFQDIVSNSPDTELNTNKAVLEKAILLHEKETAISLQSVQELIAQIREEAKKHILSDEAMLAAANKTRRIVMTVGVVAIFVGIIFGLIISKLLSSELKRTSNFAQVIAKGDFSKKLDINQNDEIGILAASLNGIISNVGNMITDIKNGIDTVSSSSTELSSITDQMTISLEETTTKSNSVASSSEEMSVSMVSISSASEQASNNVNMVASAIEEMNTTISEIARNAANTSAKTGEAVKQVANVSAEVDSLGVAAKEIDKVTEAITAISDQTNLLALNATIEAARAGEAGRGFAVVANEIKELAKQTSDATQEIKAKIKGIQKTTEGTINAAVAIKSIINDVNEMVMSIASAVEEQSVTAKDISANVAQAAQGISEVNGNMNQGREASEAIARDIVDVNHSTNEILNSSSQINKSSSELNNLAEKLNVMVSKFTI
jgi:methyl-accepting chemotaxis protein